MQPQMMPNGDFDVAETDAREFKLSYDEDKKRPGKECGSGSS